MDLFGMGFGEILLILVVALVIWAPGKIPEIARTLGKTVRAFRKASFDLTSAVTKEFEEEKEEEKKRSHQPSATDADKAGKSTDAAKPDPGEEDTAGSEMSET